MLPATIALFSWLLVSSIVKANEAPLIAYSAPPASVYFWESMKDAAFDSAAERIVLIDYSVPDFSSEKQLYALHKSLNEQISGYLVGPISDQMLEFVDELYQRGIPIVTVDVPISSSWAKPQIYTDNIDAASKAAIYLHKRVIALGESPGRILIISGDQQNKNARSRVAGMVDTLKPLGYQFDIYYAKGWLPQEALTAILKAFDTKIDYQAAFATFADASVALAEAVNYYQLKHLIRIGFDQTPSTMALIKNKELDALIAQDPKKMAELGVKYLLDRIAGIEVPEEVTVPALLITPKKNGRKP